MIFFPLCNSEEAVERTVEGIEGVRIILIQYLIERGSHRQPRERATEGPGEKVAGAGVKCLFTVLPHPPPP
jgi:hypothetical protein